MRRIGRGLIADDCAAGAAPVVVLGHGLWVAEFGADPRWSGDTVVLNSQPFTVVGIAPKDVYGGGDSGAVWWQPGFFAPTSASASLYPNARLSVAASERLGGTARRRD